MAGDVLGAAVLGASTVDWAAKCGGGQSGSSRRSGGEGGGKGGSSKEGGGEGGGGKQSNVLCRAARACLRPPYSLTLLSCFHGMLMVLLAQPHFVLALLGQIFMGTVYVFYEQSLQELLLVYSFSDHALYRRLVFAHYLAFTAGCALCSPIAYGIYGASESFSVAFYATAAFAAVVGVAIGAYFACRLARTPGGVLGSLEAAEDHLGRERRH